MEGRYLVVFSANAEGSSTSTRHYPATKIRKAIIISTKPTNGHLFLIKQALLIVLFVLLAQNCLANQSGKDRDLMKDIKSYHDQKVSTKKRSPPDQNIADEIQNLEATDTTSPQTQGKRSRASSQPDDAIKTAKRQRCVDHCIRYESKIF